MLQSSRSARRRLLLWALPALSLFSVWHTHVILTELGDPFGIPFDVVLWIVSSALKIVSVLVTPVLVSAVYSSIASSRRRAAVAFAIWIIVGSSVVGISAATRELWAPVLTNSAVKYYSFGNSPIPNPRLEVMDPSAFGLIGQHWRDWKTALPTRQ